MNKMVHPTYLGNENKYLIVVAADIEGVHGIPLDSTYILDWFQRDIKAVKFCCGDN